MDFKQLQEANATIQLTDIKGKKYAEVHQRIKAFRMCYPEGSIVTDLKHDKDGRCVFTATVYAEYPSKILGTGTAYESESSSYINKTSYMENCETSAVGRALGMCGFGIDGSVSSAEEANNAKELTDLSLYAEELQNYTPKCSDCKRGILPIYKRDKTPWHVNEIVIYSTGRFGRCLCPECQKKALKSEKEEST